MTRVGLIAILLIGGGCADRALKRLGDLCASSTECASGRCDERVCKSAMPAALGSACSHPLECRSDRCTDGRCAPGNRATGAPCTDDLQCLAGRCLAAVCAGSLDGGSLDGGDGPRSDGTRADGSPGDGWRDSAPTADARQLDAGPADARADLPLLSSALLHYSFDDHLLNQGALGPTHDGVASSVTFVDGLSGRALRFAGTAGSFLQLPGSAAAINPHPAVTIALWFRDPAGGTGGSSLIDFRGTVPAPAPPLGAALGCQTDRLGASPGQWMTCCGTGTPGIDACTETGYLVDRWHHLILRHAGTSTTAGGGADLQIYLDGRPAGVVADPGGTPFFSDLSDDLLLGAYSRLLIDELRVYDRVFSEAEQCTSLLGGSWDGSARACQLPDPPAPDPLLLHYTFDGHARNSGSLGSYHDGQASEVTYAAGVHGQAVRCAGTPDSFVELPSTAGPLCAFGAYTIGLWFKEDAVVQNSALLNFRETPPPGGGCQSYHGASAQITTCCSGPPAFGGCGSFDYVPGDWHHLLYRYAGVAPLPGLGAPLEVYLDNQPVTTIDNPEAVSLFSCEQLASLALCRGPVTAGDFYLDDLRVYNRVFDLAGQCTEVIGGSWEAQTSSCTLP